MDMDGRSLGTERSSTFQDGHSNNQPGARVSDALAGGDRFATVLASRTEHGGDANVQDDVSARIREGRTDAASSTYNSREARDKAWKPRDDRTVERTDSSESWEPAEARPEAQQGADDAALDSVQDAGSGSTEGPRGASAANSEGAATADAMPELDASEAQGLAGSKAALPAAAGPIGSNLTQGSAGPTASAAQAMASRGSLQGLLQGANGSAASRAQSGSPAQAVQATTATAATKAASKAAAPRPPVAPEDARAILNEVRIQILDGKREARIQLRPIELGRLDLLIRVDGNHVVAKVAAESAEALAVLESHAPELRAWLAKDGAESVDLEFSLIEPGNEEFAHGSDGGQGAGFEGAAERRSFASASPSRRPAAETDSAPHDVAPRPTPQSGVDFVA